MLERGAGWEQGEELSVVFGCEEVGGVGEGGDGDGGAVWVSWVSCWVVVVVWWVWCEARRFGLRGVECGERM